MSREIKFRFWDNTNNCYWEPTYRAYKGELEDMTISKNGQLIKRDMTPSPTALPINQDKYVIEQYTGLKDNNGVEIYEGDIVRTFPRIFSDDDGDTVHCMPVAFSGKCASFILKGAQPLDWYIENFYGFEVIGNIHENPKLLDE